MNTIALIPARGGSKGIPGKNIKDFAGKPLIVHSIEQAIEVDAINGVYVSTDDAQIAAISREAGAHIIDRPVELSGDTATTESAVEHAISDLAANNNIPDVIVLLQATSPLRPADGIAKAIETFISEKFDSLLTISSTHEFFWKLDGKQAIAQYDYLNRPRRQDFKSEDIPYVENGSFYIFSRSHFKKFGNRLGGKIGYEIFPEEYKYQIDSLEDFMMLEKIYHTIHNLD